MSTYDLTKKELNEIFDVDKDYEDLSKEELIGVLEAKQLQIIVPDKGELFTIIEYLTDYSTSEEGSFEPGAKVCWRKVGREKECIGTVADLDALSKEQILKCLIDAANENIL